MENNVVLISGGAGKLGVALASGIIKAGGKVVLVDVDEEGLDNIAKDLPRSSCLTLVADACFPDEVDRCIGDSVLNFGHLDAAIHSAYPRSDDWGCRFEDLQIASLNKNLTNQLGGAIIFSQRILEFFKKQGHGNLIHISSIMGVAVPKFESYYGTQMSSPIEYTASKSALIAITRYLAKYYKNNNIRVNCISPGGIVDGQPNLFLENYRSHCNSKGMLNAEDILGTALYLLSNESKYVTGQNIIVDDGWSL